MRTELQLNSLVQPTHLIHIIFYINLQICDLSFKHNFCWWGQLNMYSVVYSQRSAYDELVLVLVNDKIFYTLTESNKLSSFDFI